MNTIVVYLLLLKTKNMQTTLTNENYSFIQALNREPKEDEIRKNEDGSLYIPISIVQYQLDDLFCGHWSFQMTRETFGRKWARGSGVMEVIHPFTGHVIRRNGDAAIILTGNLRTDSPRLEAMVLLSCAKKLGKRFGRDLNRGKEDAPLPVVRVAKVDESNEEIRMKALIDDIQDPAELETYRLVVPASLKKYFESKLKKLSK
jgi:hypothetical protein